MARSRLVRLFAEDFGTKILAFVIALLLWVAVSFLGTRTLVLEDISVGVVNLRDDLALASPLEAVAVKIRAPRVLLRQRDSRDLVRAFVDVSGRGLGAQSAEVAVSPVDPRVDVVIVLPQRINFTLDPVVQRSLSVHVTTEGSPADGYAVGEAATDPKTVQVRGALGRLQVTQAIEVKVSVQGAGADIAGEYSLSPPEGVSLVTDRVRVTLEIIQAEATKTLGVRVVTEGSPAAGYWVRSVQTIPSVVTVKGPREAIASLAFIETDPVSVQDARSATERTADLVLPEAVTLQGEAPRVTVKIEVAPLEGTKEVGAAVQVNDVPDGLRVTAVSPGSVRVTLRGSGEVFDRLRDEDVRVVLSASGRGEGTFTLRPAAGDVRSFSGIGVVSVEGVDVNVTLEGS